MNLLAIDYGLKHLGLALATTSLAEPFQTVPTKQALLIIVDLINSHSIDQIIIGLPDGPIASRAKAFAQELKQHTTTPIIFHDETLSSHQAKAKLKTAKKTKRKVDHHFAAALILQDYLDFKT